MADTPGVRHIFSISRNCSLLFNVSFLFDAMIPSWDRLCADFSGEKMLTKGKQDGTIPLLETC